MIEYIINHQLEFWLALGFALLVMEVFLGFTSGVFLFAGLGALASGALMSVSLIPETWTAGVACTGISSGVITSILWKPLKRLQGGSPAEKDNSSDFVGYEFFIDSDISPLQPGSILYSGLTWKVEIDHTTGITDLKAGQRVSVTSVDVGRFLVKPLA